MIRALAIGLVAAAFVRVLVRGALADLRDYRARDRDIYGDGGWQ
jgi:hypothetical protein